VFRVREQGTYELANDTGQTIRLDVADPQARSIEGPWQVNFAPGWGAPESLEFKELKSWTANANPNIRYFSGAATYLKDVDIPAEMVNAKGLLELDLGDLREVADVRLNGKSLGVLWKAPFRVDIGSAARAGTNRLEIEVVNTWANRLIGDQELPPAQRKTKTNITKFEKGDQQPLPSGLFGPVVVRNIPLIPCRNSE